MPQEPLRFIGADQTSLWRKLRDHCIPRIVTRAEFLDRAEVIRQVRQDVEAGQYCVSALFATVSEPKSSGVARFIPVFTSRDYAVFFSCIRMLDTKLSTYRTPNTFGAWTLRGEYQTEEAAQVQEIVQELPPPDYIPYGAESYNPYAWLYNWNQYWRLARTFTLGLGDYSVAKLDIANFYDNVDLARLERMLRRDAPDDQVSIEVLLFFLRYWNRQINLYAPSSQGLPQDVVADCSRVLANFYIWEFDRELREYCLSHNLTYLRYADDLTLIGPANFQWEALIFRVSQLLNVIGLNLNASKVETYSRDAFEDYWQFDILINLDANDVVLNEAGIQSLQTVIDSPAYGRSQAALGAALGRVHRHSELRQYSQWVSSVFLSSRNRILRCKDGQFLKILHLASDPLEAVELVCTTVLSAPYSLPVLRLIRAAEKLIAGNPKWLGWRVLDRVVTSSWATQPLISRELSSIVV